jgi:hypothetical protein
MATLEDLTNLGYEITQVNDEDAETKIGVVNGFGIQNLYVVEGDQETLDRLANSEAHASRQLQHENPDATPDQILDANLAAQVSLGDITQTEADQLKQDWVKIQTPATEPPKEVT